MLSSFGSVKNEELEAFQRKYHLKLPEDYKKYLLENNGGITHDLCFRVKKIKEPIPLATLYGIRHENKNLSIETWQDEYGDELSKNMVIIGGVEFGGAILLINQRFRKGVYFWDDALDYEGSTERRCVYFIAKTFDEFMKGLFVFEDDGDE